MIWGTAAARRLRAWGRGFARKKFCVTAGPHWRSKALGRSDAQTLCTANCAFARRLHAVDIAAGPGPLGRRNDPMNLLSLDIRMLRSLISVADTGSVTETARRLGRSQPAISLQIQRLEDITGKALFHHEG